MPKILFESYHSSDNKEKATKIIEEMERYHLQRGNKDEGGEPVSYDDEVLVFLKYFKIGDNHEPWPKGDAEVSVTFQFATHEVTTNKILGTFKGVKDNSLLPAADVLLMPRTKVQDHLTISIDAIELDAQQYSQISKLLELISGIVQKIPIPGADSVTKIVNELAGSIINLISYLDDDDIIIRETRTSVVDQKTYGNAFPSNKYLKTGLVVFEEKLDEEKKKYLVERKKALAAIGGNNAQQALEEFEPTRIVLQIVKRTKTSEGKPAVAAKARR